MNIASSRRLIQFAALLAAFVGAVCDPREPSAQSNASSASDGGPTWQQMLANITVHAPDAFYDPAAGLPSRFGGLLRSEPFKDVVLQPVLPGRDIRAGLVSDVVVPPPVTDAYADERCAAGEQIEYWKFAGLDHRGIVQPGTSLDEPIVAWTTARFANEPQASGCARKSF